MTRPSGDPSDLPPGEDERPRPLERGGIDPRSVHEERTGEDRRFREPGHDPVETELLGRRRQAVGTRGIGGIDPAAGLEPAPGRPERSGELEARERSGRPELARELPAEGRGSPRGERGPLEAQAVEHDLEVEHRIPSPGPDRAGEADPRGGEPPGGVLDLACDGEIPLQLPGGLEPDAPLSGPLHPGQERPERLVAKRLERDGELSRRGASTERERSRDDRREGCDPRRPVLEREIRPHLERPGGARRGDRPGDTPPGFRQERDPGRELPEPERVEGEVRLHERRATPEPGGNLAGDAAPARPEIQRRRPEGEPAGLERDLPGHAPLRRRKRGTEPAEIREIQSGGVDREPPADPLRVPPLERAGSGDLGRSETEPPEIELESAALPPDPAREPGDGERLPDDLGRDRERLHLERLSARLRVQEIGRPDPRIDPPEAEQVVFPRPGALEALMEAAPLRRALREGTPDDELAPVHARVPDREGDPAGPLPGPGVRPTRGEDPVDIRARRPVERLDHDARAPDVDGDEHDVPADQLREVVADPDRVGGDEGPPLGIGQPHPVQREPPEEAVGGEGADGQLPLEESPPRGQAPYGGGSRGRSASPRGGARRGRARRGARRERPLRSGGGGGR